MVITAKPSVSLRAVAANQPKTRLLLFLRLIHQSNRQASVTATINIIPAIKSKNGPCAINVDVAALCRDGHLKEALEILHVMDQQGIPVGSELYASLLDTCANVKALEEGKQVHAHMLGKEFELNNFLGAKLVGMYAKCGSLEDAHDVFDKMPKSSVFAWNAMIREYAMQGHCEEAVTMFSRMQRAGMQPDKFTVPCLIKACAGLGVLQDGRRVHSFAVRSGFGSDVVVESALVDMYIKCGSVDDACQVFSKMHQRDAVSWTGMISGYTQSGYGNEALGLFRQMQAAGVRPDPVTISSVLPACTHYAALRRGQEIHCFMIRNGFESGVILESALVDMYAKCGSIGDAQRLFDNMSQRDVVSWNAMITGYSINGRGHEALKLFNRIKFAGIKPNQVSIAGVLSACAHLEDLQQGKHIHDYIITCGFEQDVIVMNALIAMYAKCGSIMEGYRQFERMSKKDLISWNTMIAGYTLNGRCEEAIKVFLKMQLANEIPNSITITSVLPACGRLMSMKLGETIHSYLIRRGFESDVSVGSTLLDMYGKCRNMESARKVFDSMSQRDVISWNAVIAGYVQNGNYNLALKLICEIQGEDMKPNSVTVASVLSACGYLAALQQGKEIHNFILRNEFELDLFVGTALIDMYAKCGSIKDARLIFDQMSERDIVSWTAMISGYAMHGHGEDALALFYQMQLAGLKPDDITFTAVLSACSHAGLVDEGWQNFDSISRNYGMTPSMEHYACMVDLLGRSGHLDVAQDFIKSMPVEPSASVWGALLAACRANHDIEVGETVAEYLFALEPQNAGNYASLSQIYAAAGRWDGVEKVRQMIKENGLKRRPGCSWIQINNRVHAFLAGDRSHPQTEKIYATLQNLALQMREAGYLPDTKILMHVVEEDKRSIIFNQSKRLEISFG